MSSRFQQTFSSPTDIQTLQPRLRFHGPVLILISLGLFPLFFFLLHGINRIFYCGLSILVVSVLLFHFRKEYQLVHDRLTALAVVNEYRAPWRGKSWFGRLIARKFSPDVPVIEYSFVAFDQKSHRGKTGFHTDGLFKGAKITILYRPEKPSVNHPVTSFIFYSFSDQSESCVRATDSDRTSAKFLSRMNSERSLRLRYMLGRSARGLQGLIDKFVKAKDEVLGGKQDAIQKRFMGSLGGLVMGSPLVWSDSRS